MTPLYVYGIPISFCCSPSSSASLPLPSHIILRTLHTRPSIRIISFIKIFSWRKYYTDECWLLTGPSPNEITLERVARLEWLRKNGIVIHTILFSFSFLSLVLHFLLEFSGPLLSDFARLSAPQTLDPESSTNCGKKKKKKRRHRYVLLLFFSKEKKKSLIELIENSVPSTLTLLTEQSSHHTNWRNLRRLSKTLIILTFMPGRCCLSKRIYQRTGSRYGCILTQDKTHLSWHPCHVCTNLRSFSLASGLVPEPQSQVAKNGKMLGQKHDYGWVWVVWCNGSSFTSPTRFHPQIC